MIGITKKIVILLFTLLSFGLTLLAIPSMLLFTLNITALNSFTLDPIHHNTPPLTNNQIFWNIFGFLLFAIFHSLTARKTFKEMLGPFLEKQAFALIASISLILTMKTWTPFPINKEDVAPTPNHTLIPYVLINLMGTIFFLGSMMAFPKDDIYGVNRCIEALSTGEIKKRKEVLIEPFPYNIVRHPMYLGLLTLLWSQFLLAKYQTMNRLIWHSMITIYILIGVQFEERDLIRRFGEDYIKYKERKDSIIPFAFLFANKRRNEKSL